LLILSLVATGGFLPRAVRAPLASSVVCVSLCDCCCCAACGGWPRHSSPTCSSSGLCCVAPCALRHSLPILARRTHCKHTRPHPARPRQKDRPDPTA
jgi:hypothetical protein